MAELAMLALDAEELPRYARGLERVFDHFSRIATLDTSGVAPFRHRTGSDGPLRDDVPAADGGPRMIDGAASVEDGFYRVERMDE